MSSLCQIALVQIISRHYCKVIRGGSVLSCDLLSVNSPVLATIDSVSFDSNRGTVIIVRDLFFNCPVLISIDSCST